MIVVTITSTELTPAGKRRKLYLEVEAAGIKEIVDLLNAGDIVFGCALHLKKEKGAGNVMEVTGASEIALTKGEIFRIEQPTCSLVRYEDEAAG